MELIEKKRKKVLLGEVISDAMDKTIVVKVQRTFRHALYNKVLRRVKKYKVHDEQKVAKVGDLVEFSEGRPISKTKFMYLNRVVSRTTAQ